MTGLLQHQVWKFFFNFKEFLPISTLSQISTDCSSLISRLCSVCLLPVACVLPLCESGFLLYCLATSHVHRPNLHCQSIFHSMSSVFPSLCKSWYGTGIVYFGYVAVKNGMFCICADRTSRELSYQVNIIFFFPRKKCRLLMARMCSSVFCHWLASRLDIIVTLTCVGCCVEAVDSSQYFSSVTNKPVEQKTQQIWGGWR